MVTKDICPKKNSEANPLFLSYIKPHRPITSQRVAHWIKDVLGEAGVYTNTFKARSVRGASTTAALTKGVSLQDILCIADFSTESTFQRFYYQPEKKNVYARTLLSLEDKESGEPIGTHVLSSRFGLCAIVGLCIYTYTWPRSVMSTMPLTGGGGGGGEPGGGGVGSSIIGR